MMMIPMMTVTINDWTLIPLIIMHQTTHTNMTRGAVYFDRVRIAFSFILFIDWKRLLMKEGRKPEYRERHPLLRPVEIVKD